MKERPPYPNLATTLENIRQGILDHYLDQYGWTEVEPWEIRGESPPPIPEPVKEPRTPAPRHPR